MTGIASGVESGSNSGSGKAGRGIPPPPPSAAPSSSSAKYTANTSPELLYRQIIQSCVSLQSIPMLVVTWNVNAHVESIASLRDALFYPREDDVQSPSNNHTNSMSLPHPINPYTTGESSDNSRPMSTSVFSDIGEDRSIIHPKLVVVGLQEMVELSTTSVLSSTVIGQQCQERLTTWETMILDCLHLENSYFELISSHYMVGLALMVFATADIKAMMHHYQISSLPRGVGGVLGNKGALYARFELLDSSICIVNAHFAAHRNAVKKRNADYNAIVSHKAFPDYLHDKLQALTQYTGNEVNLSNYESSHIQQLRSKLHSIDKKIHHLQSDVMQHSLHFHSTNYVEGSPLQGLPLHPSSEVRSSVVDGDGSVGRSSAASTTSLSTSSSLPSSTSSSTQPPNSSSSQPPPPPHHVSHHPQYHPSHSHHHHHKHRHYKKKHTHEGNALSAEDHDIILWLGDLNYRIQDDLDMMTVYEMIDRDEIIPLAMFDQLNQERDIGNAFHNFHEGLLTFPPTYQYIPGTNEYDRRKDKKMRCPAWCDRILWRVGKESIERERTSLIEQDIHSIASSSFILPSSSAGNGDNGSATAGEEKISRAVKALEEDSDTDNEEESTHSDDQKTNKAGNDSDNEVITDFDQIIEDLKVKKTHEINQRMSLRNLRKSLLEEENSKMSLLATVSELNNLQIDESIELMSYHRCSNVISDHKPVKAVLNVKVKR